MLQKKREKQSEPTLANVVRNIFIIGVDGMELRIEAADMIIASEK